MEETLLKQLSLRAIVFLIVFGCTAVWAQQPATNAHPDVEEWRDLFEPDLSNAVLSPGGWVMENGVLSAKGHGMIWTRKSYANFVLDLEFKVAVKGSDQRFFG